MRKCPICGDDSQDKYICTTCGYDESKDYEQYKTLSKVPQKILKQYKGKKVASDSWRKASSLNDAVKEENIQEEINPIIPKKSFIKKDILLGIGIGVFAMLLLSVFLGKGKEQDSLEPGMLEVQQEDIAAEIPMSNDPATESDQEYSLVIDQEKPRFPLKSDAEGYDWFESQSTNVFGSEYLRKDITEIRFLNSMASAPLGDYWDVSADASGSVIAWVKSGVEESVPDSEADVPQVLYIAAEGIIQAPEDCRFLFAGYENVHTIDFNNCFDTSQVKDMGYMFFYCESLPSVDVSRFDTSQVTSMSAMFDVCSSLLSVDVSGFDTSQVTKLGNMFYGCESLTSVDVSGFDTSQVTNMCDMFHGCSSLTSVDVSGFNTSQVTDMAGLFMSCASLTSVDVSGFDTSQVTDMSMMFLGCNALTSVDVSGFDTSQVTDMSRMFEGCRSLTRVDVSRFNTSQVTDMTGMFESCSSLTSVDVSGFDTSQVVSMESMFLGCSSLTSVDVSRFDISKVELMSGMFDDNTTPIVGDSGIQP